MASTATLRAPATAAARSRWRQLALTLAPLIVLILLCVILGLINPNFFGVRNLSRIATQSAIPLVLGIGLTFVIVMGSIDLSIEGLVSLTAVVLSLLVLNGLNANDWGLLGVLAVLAVATGAGLVNGALHVGLKIPSFMATLGMWFVGVGAANAVLGGEQVRINDELVRALALERFLEMPYAVWLALAVLAVAWVIEQHTRLGRYVFAIGGGEDLAKLSGINVARVRIIVFGLAGFFYGIGGIIAAAQQGSGFPTIGQGRLFTTVTAVVVGGTSLMGGTGGVLNTLVGVLIVTVLANGMVLMGISPYVQQAVQGAMIIVAVALTIDRMRMKINK